MKNIADLHKAIEQSKGREIHQKLRGLNHTKIIFNRNYFWLVQLEKYLAGNMEIIELRNHDKLDDFQIEFARHLHNYLASVKSLIDHTRVLKKKLSLDEKFEEKYKEQQKTLLGTDTITFIQQLREYVQHYELLPTGVEVLINDNDKEKITLILTTSSLKEFSNWKAASLRVLQTCSKNVDIFILLKEYQISVEKFYKWFYDEMGLIFKSELAEFDELGREYKMHYKKIIEQNVKNKSI